MRYLNDDDFTEYDKQVEETRRRLARYNEAIRLIQEYRSEWENPSSDLLYRRKCRDRLFAFLASEPKEGR